MYNTKNTKAIIFDLDGTLIDTRKDLATAANFALKEFGLNEYELDSVIEKTGRGTKKLMNDLAPNLSSVDKEKLYLLFRNYYKDHLTVYSIPYDGVVDTLNRLKEKGYKMAVVSNKDDEFVKTIINKFFNGIFDFVTGSQEGLRNKPENDLVHLALYNLKVTTNEACYVGDTLIDFLTAHNSMLTPLLVSYGYQKKSDLELKGVPIIMDSFNELLMYL